MYRNRNVPGFWLKYATIAMAGLFLLFAIFSSSIQTGLAEPGTVNQQAAANTAFPTWSVFPADPIIQPSLPISGTVVWDTAYAKVGSVLKQGGLYKMWYESATAISGTIVVGSAIGYATSVDGLVWIKGSTDAPVFARGASGAWDSAFVGSPKVYFDGTRFTMFYNGGSSGVRYGPSAPSAIGYATSPDGINWTRITTAAPALAPTGGTTFDSINVYPTSVRISGSNVAVYYTGSNGSSYASGLATYPVGTLGNGTATLLVRNALNPIKVDGISTNVVSPIVLSFKGSLIIWFTSSATGTYRIYQGVSRTAGNELDFIKDPATPIVPFSTGSITDQGGQVSIGGAVLDATKPQAELFYTGLSSAGLKDYGFRAVSPPQSTTNPTPNLTTTAGNGPVIKVTPVNLPTRSGSKPPASTPLPGLPIVPPAAGPSAPLQPTPVTASYSPFYSLWRRVDEPVLTRVANRSWIYGDLPYGFRTLREAYELGTRLVVYHDKARMEAFGSDGVSLGLLSRELISGRLQVGDNKFDQRVPANEAVAGDYIEVNPLAPAYWTLNNVASLNNDRRAPDATGQPINATLNRKAQVGTDFAKGNFGISNAYYEPTLGHNIANVFWDFMLQSGPVAGANGITTEQVVDWKTVYGLPITEPYWTQANVAGQPRDVMIQAFERRVLTYTPANPDAYKVEVGNVGRHYFRWRYGQNP